MEFSSLKILNYLTAPPNCTIEEEKSVILSSWANDWSRFEKKKDLYISLSPLLWRLESSKPQRTAGLFCYRYPYNDKLRILVRSCLFCRGILIPLGMSENKSYIVRQEVSLATEIRGHAEICHPHLNMRRSGLQAKHKGERRNNCSAGDQNKVLHPCSFSFPRHISLHMDFSPRQAESGRKIEKIRFYASFGLYLLLHGLLLMWFRGNQRQTQGEVHVNNVCSEITGST